MARAAKKKQHAKPKPKSRGVSTPRRATARKKAVAKAKPKVAAKKKAVAKLKAKPKAKAASKKKLAPAKRSAAKKKAVAKRVAPKAKPKAKAATLKKKPVAKRPAPKPVAKKSPVARKPSPPAFAAQKANASARDLLIFELVRARAAVKAAVQGLPSGGATRPIAPGKWSPLEIVLHLSERDRVRLDEFDRALAGVPRSWANLSDGEMAAVNEAHLAPLRAHTWEEAIRRMDSLRAELMERISALPAQPEHIFKPGHAFGDMISSLPGHDRNHAMQIKNARIGGRAPVEA